MIIAVIGRKTGSADAAHSNLCKLLLDFADTVYSRGHIVMVDTETHMNFFRDANGELLNDPNIMFKPLETIGNRADLAVIFGGDGTMLYTAKALSQYNIPMLGVNLGRLGFITDVPSDFPHDSIIDMLVNNEYTTEKRHMLMVSDIVGNRLALNDVVISRATGKVIEFKIFIDHEYAYQARGDGLMVSTPTGSTAYAMSAGGPIIHPTARVLELVPIFPQTLSCRPLIINDTSSVSFELVSGEANILVDGNEVRKISEGMTIEIAKADRKIDFIHPNTDKLRYSYYHTLREKLNWQHLPGTPRI